MDAVGGIDEHFPLSKKSPAETAHQDYLVRSLSNRYHHCPLTFEQPKTEVFPTC